MSSRYQDALLLACSLHERQVRKQNQIPYISHLLAVSALVLEAGGNEDEAIAALLHDSVEDAGYTLAKLEARYGSLVASIVGQLTELEDSVATTPAERKAEYARRVLTMSDSAVLVSLCDKLHNLRCYAQNPKLASESVRVFYHQLIPNYAERGLTGVVELKKLYHKLWS